MATLLSAHTVRSTELPDPAKAEEFRPRSGLPNFFAKIDAGQPVRIAYFGGSITYAGGWRLKTLSWFREQFPQAAFSEINSSIPGTGSDYGACRLQQDVLQHNPDLVFVEFRVNGGGGFEELSMEGIVRQIWKHNPHTDICFVYTAGFWMFESLQKEQNVAFGEIMERIANRYGIPSIDVGLEIAKQVQTGNMTTQHPEPGKIQFSVDGVHPTDEGHQVYSDIITRAMLKMSSESTPSTHSLGKPVNPNCWDTATLLPIQNAELSAGWSLVDRKSDPVYTDDAARTDDMLRGAVKCSREGETITVHWTGTGLGLSDIPYGGTSVVEAVVDGKTVTLEKRTQTEPQKKFARFWHIPEQIPGRHTAVFTVKQLPENTSYYAGQLLIVGKPTH